MVEPLRVREPVVAWIVVEYPAPVVKVLAPSALIAIVPPEVRDAVLLDKTTDAPARVIVAPVDTVRAPVTS